METLSLDVVDKNPQKNIENGCSIIPNWVDGNIKHCQVTIKLKGRLYTEI